MSSIPVATADEQREADDGLVSALIVAFAVGAIIFIIFAILRKKWRQAYYLKPHLEDKVVLPEASSGSWWRRAFFRDHWSIVPVYGYDKVLYLTFLRACLVFFLILMVLGLILLIPVDATASRKDKFVDNAETDTASDTATRRRALHKVSALEPMIGGSAILSIANIDNNDPTEMHRYWAHIIFCILSSILAYFGAYKLSRYNYAHVMALKAFDTPHNRTVKITRIPKGVTQDALEARLDALFPGKVLAVHQFRDYRKLGKARDKWRDLLHQRKRIFESDQKKMRETTTCLSCNACCCCKPKVNAKNYIDHEYKNATQKYLARQRGINSKPYKSLAYVTFTDVQTARLCAASHLDVQPNKWHTQPAEEPRDIYWHMSVPSHRRKMMWKVLIGIFFVFVIIFWSIPLQFALSLANLNSVARIPGIGSGLAAILGANSFLKGIVEGLLPALVVVIFYQLIVPFLRFLSRREYIRSRTGVEIETERMLTALLFINVFGQSLIAGSFWGIAHQLGDLASQPLRLVNLLAVKIPAQVNFFIAYVLTHTVIAYMLKLLRPFNLLKIWWVSRKGKSRRDREQVYMRNEFDYANQYGHHMLIFLIVLTYSAIAPIILIFGVLYFLFAYLVDYHNHLYVFRNRYEGFGNMWPTLFGQICIALFIYQLVLLAILVLVGFYPALILIALLVATVAFYAYVRHKFFYRQDIGSLDLETEDFGITDEQMKRAYRHPALVPIEVQEEMDDMEVSEEVGKSIPNDGPPSIEVEKDNDQK